MAWMFVQYVLGVGIFGSILMGQALLAEAHGFFLLLLGVFLIGIPILVGSLGNQWWEKNLVKRGYEYKETVEAPTPEAPLALWTKEEKQ